MADIISSKLTEFNAKSNQLTMQYELNGDHTLVISPSGSLDTYNSQMFSTTLCDTLSSNPTVKTLVFNLKLLTYVSSTGIGAFTMLLGFCQKNSIRLFLMNLSEKSRSVFDILGFTNFFKFISDVKEAL